MSNRLMALIAGLALGLLGAIATAQEMGVTFGGLKADTSLPVEVKADTLAVDQASGLASFTGNVLVVQGAMRLSADEVRVEYAKEGGKIARLHASGKVLLVNATDAAEASEAVYPIDTGEVVMTGSVLLTQGQAAIRGQKLVIDLKSGTGRMEGGVTTTFVPGGN